MFPRIAVSLSWMSSSSQFYSCFTLKMKTWWCFELSGNICLTTHPRSLQSSATSLLETQISQPTFVLYWLLNAQLEVGKFPMTYVYSRHHSVCMFIWSAQDTICFRFLCADCTQCVDTGWSDSHHRCPYMLHSCHGWLHHTASVRSLCQESGKHYIPSGTTHPLVLFLSLLSQYLYTPQVQHALYII